MRRRGGGPRGTRSGHTGRTRSLGAGVGAPEVFGTVLRLQQRLLSQDLHQQPLEPEAERGALSVRGAEALTVPVTRDGEWFLNTARLC